MGKVASRYCMKGCEGGKNEIGEENLQSIIDESNLQIKREENINVANDITKNARSANMQDRPANMQDRPANMQDRPANIQDKVTERFPNEKKCKIKINLNKFRSKRTSKYCNHY